MSSRECCYGRNWWADKQTETETEREAFRDLSLLLSFRCGRPDEVDIEERLFKVYQ